MEIENILTKIANMYKNDWAGKLIEVVWTYNTTWNTTTGFTPYELVYGKKTRIPIEFEINTLRNSSSLNLDSLSDQKERLQHLNALDEYR
jgi:hypothetical protein